MAELKNEFSWSWSRHRTFETCLRKYYLQHYGFWGGWNAGSENREVYIQKKLMNRPMWIGTTVHRSVEWVLNQVREGHFPSVERVVERTLREARRTIDESQRGMYRIQPKRSPGFLDHYYDEGTPEHEWEAAVAEIERQLRALFENRVFLRLTSVPERILEVERLEKLWIDGTLVWVSLDVLVGDGDGGFVIIDWKTGAHHDPEKVKKQLGIYGLYVANRYLDIPVHAFEQAKLPSIQGMYVNLRSSTFETATVDQETAISLLSEVRQSAQRMRALLVDTEGNEAEISDFPMVELGHPECGRCNFRRTCQRD